VGTDTRRRETFDALVDLDGYAAATDSRLVNVQRVRNRNHAEVEVLHLTAIESIFWVDDYVISALFVLNPTKVVSVVVHDFEHLQMIRQLGPLIRQQIGVPNV